MFLHVYFYLKVNTKMAMIDTEIQFWHYAIYEIWNAILTYDGCIAFPCKSEFFQFFFQVWIHFTHTQSAWL